MVLDYFQGNRSPYTDPHARGLISGLSLRHGPGHLFRAILEGICFGTELILRTLRRHDFELRSIAAAGGATRSQLWMQLHADVANVPVSIPREPESPVLGAAMLAAVGPASTPTSRRPRRRWSTSSGPSSPTPAATPSTASGWTATASCTRPPGT